MLFGLLWNISSGLLSPHSRQVFYYSRLYWSDMLWITTFYVYEYFLILSLFLFQFEFLISFLNIIDLLGILPFFFSLFLNLLSSQYSLEYIAKAAQIFRILRILRIFKLSRHITGLKTLGTTLRNSHRLDILWHGTRCWVYPFRELLLLCMTVSMGMLIFAGLGYALEKDEPDTMFYTLPQTLYWAIITMTSTGKLHIYVYRINIHYCSQARYAIP